MFLVSGALFGTVYYPIFASVPQGPSAKGENVPAPANASQGPAAIANASGGVKGPVSNSQVDAVINNLFKGNFNDFWTAAQLNAADAAIPSGTLTPSVYAQAVLKDPSYFLKKYGSPTTADQFLANYQKFSSTAEQAVATFKNYNFTGSSGTNPLGTLMATYTLMMRSGQTLTKEQSDALNYMINNSVEFGMTFTFDQNGKHVAPTPENMRVFYGLDANNKPISGAVVHTVVDGTPKAEAMAAGALAEGATTLLPPGTVPAPALGQNKSVDYVTQVTALQNEILNKIRVSSLDNKLNPDQMAQYSAEFSTRLAKILYPDSSSQSEFLNAFNQRIPGNNWLGTLSLKLNDIFTLVSGVPPSLQSLADQLTVFGNDPRVQGIIYNGKGLLENVYITDPNVLAMSITLQKAGFTLGAIDYINSCYTSGGRILGDMALADLLGKDNPAAVANYLALLKQGTPLTSLLNAADLTQLGPDGTKQLKPAFKFAKMAFSTSLAIDMQTADLVYTSQVWQTQPDGTLKNVGYMSWDPVTKSYDTQLTTDFAGKNVTFSSDPRNGFTYITVGNPDGTALLKQGQLQLMQVQISADGGVGGSFQYGDRIFNYNANSKAFEIPINIDQKGKIYIAQNVKPGNIAKGTIYLDTNGHITGSYSLINTESKSGLNQNGSIFFDQTGNIGFTYFASQTTGAGTVNEQTRDIAGISINSNGGVNGTVNLGKVLNFKSDVYVGFGKNGLTNVNIPLGSTSVTNFAAMAQNVTNLKNVAAQTQQMANDAKTAGDVNAALAQTNADAAKKAADAASKALQDAANKTKWTGSLGINLQTGALSYGGVLQVAALSGIPIPLSVGQNDHGDLSLDIGIPFIGSLLGKPLLSIPLCGGIFHACDNRPLTAPAPKTDSSGNTDMTITYCKHSFKKGIQTVRVYNTLDRPEEVLTPEKQAQRSAIIFKDFNDLLGRNPGQTEYVRWYFYMNDELNDRQCNDPTYFESILIRDLKATKEYRCIQKNGGVVATNSTSATATTTATTTKKASDCPGPPADLMTADPLNQPTTTTTTADVSGGNSVNDFINGVTDSASNDPLWNGSGWTGLGESGDITNAQISLAKGYNAFFVPSNMTAVDASVFDVDKFVLFSFNGDGSKEWYSSEKSALPKYLQPGTGYYVYSRSDDVKVPLKDVAGATTGVQVHQGWNLLANATGQAAKLSELKYSVVKTAECKSIDCTESKSLRDLYSAGRAYAKIYVVSDDKTTDASKAFQVLTIDSQNVDSTTIPTGKIFWFYLK